MTEIVALEDHIKLYEFDPVLGWYGKPNIEAEYEAQEGLTHVKHNSIGNRDREHPLETRGKRIVVLGGSMTWGQGVEAEGTFVARLAASLPHLDVMNFGHCNFGLDQCLLSLQTKAARYRPDIVVLEQHPWVLYRLMLRFNKGYPKPYYWLGKDGKLLLRKLDPSLRLAPLRGVYMAYLRYLKDVEDAMSPVDLLKNYRKTHDPMFSHLVQTRYNGLYKLSRSILAELAQGCARQKIKILVVMTTTLHQLDFETPNLLFDYDIPSDRLRAALTQLGLPYLDLHPILAPVHRSGRRVIFRDDGHWNALGHELAGEAVRAKLGQLGWV